MPLTGKFEADFESFYDAVQKANVALSGFEGNTRKVESQLDQMVESFSGRKIIQDAALMTQAVERIGGTAKLTESELKRVGATVSEGMAKMRLMGETVPPGMLKIADATGEVNTGVLALMENVPVVGQLLGAWSLANLATGLFNFAAGAIEAADNIVTLSQATGVATDDLQRMAYVGEGFNISLEEMGRGVGEFSTRLAKGDASAVGAVHSLGLSVESLMAMGPTEAFLQFAEAAGQVEDPMSKSALVSEAFGDKLGRVLLPALRDLRTEMANVPSQAIISDEALQRASDFDQKIKQLTITLKGMTVEALNFGAKLESIKPGTFFEDVARLWRGSTEGAQAAAQATTQASDATLTMVSSHGQAITNVDLLTNRLTALRTEAMAPLSEVQQQQILELQQYGTSLTLTAQLVHSNEVAVKRFLDTNRDAEAEQKKYTEALTEMQSAGEGWQGTLAAMEPAMVTGIAHYLDAGVAQSALATAYGVTATQIKAVATMLAEEKKAATEAQKAREQLQQALMTAYEADIARMKTRLETTLQAYDTSRQIAMVHALDQAEQAAAITVYLALDAEKDRAKVREGAARRHQELLTQEAKLQEQLALQRNAQVAAEFQAQVALNKLYGIDAVGNIALQETALDRLNTKLAELHAKKQEGIDQTAQEQLLIREFEQALYDEAVALDKVIASQAGLNAEMGKTTEVAAAATAALSTHAAAAASALPGAPIPGTSPTGFTAMAGGGMSPEIAEAWKMYELTHPRGPSVGIASGRLGVEDFETWRRRTYGLGGHAAYPTSNIAGGATTNANVNVTMNGMLSMDEPQTRRMLEQIINRSLAEVLKGQRLL
jgi:hypothetical protein